MSATKKQKAIKKVYIQFGKETAKGERETVKIILSSNLSPGGMRAAAKLFQEAVQKSTESDGCFAACAAAVDDEDARKSMIESRTGDSV